jgi:hypothetical protein
MRLLIDAVVIFSVMVSISFVWIMLAVLWMLVNPA